MITNAAADNIEDADDAGDAKNDDGGEDADAARRHFNAKKVILLIKKPPLYNFKKNTIHA